MSANVATARDRCGIRSSAAPASAPNVAYGDAASTIDDHHANALDDRADRSRATAWSDGVDRADATATASATNVAARRAAALSNAIMGGAAAALGQVPVLIVNPRRGRALLGFLKPH